jgi:hypothetical protein
MPIETLTCPEDCSTETLPVVSFDDCNPEIKLSELTYAYVALENAAEFEDASQPTEWAARLSQTSTTAPSGGAIADLIRPLTIIGDIPAPSTSDKDISGGRKISTKTERTVNFDIDEASGANYEFARKTECGNFKCKMWFETRGGILLGGNKGITGKLVIRPIYGRGTDEIEKYQASFIWISTTSPDRCVSPLAH